MKKALFGPPVAEKIYNGIKKELAKNKLKPFLAVILVGENQESLTYIRAKEKIAHRLDLDFQLYHLSENTSEEKVIKLLEKLNLDKKTSGIIVQLPLPTKFNTDKILQTIAPKKDIDGFSGLFPTPAAAAILEILKFYKIVLHGKNIVLVGRGKLVGKPLEEIFNNMNVAVKICDKGTMSLSAETVKADILISATGAPGLITKDMISKNTIVIDAGTAEVGGKIHGDIDPSVYQIASSYSPVPGGVGPVTVACLMKNLIQAAKNK